MNEFGAKNLDTMRMVRKCRRLLFSPMENAIKVIVYCRRAGRYCDNDNQLR